LPKAVIDANDPAEVPCPDRPDQGPVGAGGHRLGAHQVAGPQAGQGALVAALLGDGHQQVAAGDHPDHPATVDHRGARHRLLVEAAQGVLGRHVGRQQHDRAGHGVADGAEKLLEAGRFLHGRGHLRHLLVPGAEWEARVLM
jgi:hypothetical protein